MSKKKKPARMVRPERKILANKCVEEICKKKCSCLSCSHTIDIGAKIFNVKTRKGEVRAKFCTRNCQQEYEHKYLEENGFYKDCLSQL